MHLLSIFHKFQYNNYSKINLFQDKRLELKKMNLFGEYFQETGTPGEFFHFSHVLLYLPLLLLPGSGSNDASAATLQAIAAEFSPQKKRRKQAEAGRGQRTDGEAVYSPLGGRDNCIAPTPYNCCCRCTWRGSSQANHLMPKCWKAESLVELFSSLATMLKLATRLCSL